MNKICILLFFFITQNIFAQKFYLKIEGSSIKETHIIDSLDYIKQHLSVASILEEQKTFENKLLANGYFSQQLIEQKKINDSSFVFRYKINNPISAIIVKTKNLTDEERELLAIDKDSVSILPSEIENWMKLKLGLLERKGYALAKLQLVNQKNKDLYIYSDLKLSLNIKRQVNDLVILGYDKFPKNIKQNWLRKLRNRTFNQELINEVSNDIENFPFVTQTRSPEILFTKDSTKIYAYLEKTKPNKFDGFIGFANDEKNTKLTFNGYLDLNLINILNSGEKFNLYWRNDGNQQTSFNIGTEIPYWFKTPFGTKANLKIFKQDSTFQNTQLNLDVGYYFSYNKKLYLGYQSINSVDIQSVNSINLNDFSSKFYTLNFDYVKRNNTDFLFPEKTNFYFKIGTGNRTITAQNTNQFFGELTISHNLYLNNKNVISIKNQSYYLESENYVINELYRFGGINSIRGFRENTLQANFFSGIMAEYRYLLTPSLYVHSITDYGYFQDKTTNLQGSLLGLGFGFGILTQNGLFQLVYANGSTDDQAIKLSNSIVQISFKTNF
ncbi:hypothetical protein [Flavobacterium okayamense]|uniref:Membrane protein n=1 Tax=Flavobacterium okayamense TaxID=2830782 RepID=A0ABN6HUV2_9FLAO|nr:hypothetical protein [Flavobacterium okayamense]BCY27327.1 membrane protein [Flavobacterium okayamense]